MSELTFVVNNDARQVAWKLCVETRVTVSTQPLADEDGIVREALASLYGLFETTRDILKVSHPSVPVSGSPTVEYLAVTMLNRELRPFLSKWHPRLRGYEKSHPDDPESAWPENAACRGELSLDPPMILKAGSRSPRSDPHYPFPEAALTRCIRQQRQSGR